MIWRLLKRLGTFVTNLFRFRKRRQAKGAGISLLVPFKTDHADRERNWEWLRAYWRSALPLAEIILQGNDDIPFSKTRAVNRAFRRSTGDVIVILDADAYMDASTLLEAARRVREEPDHAVIPYRRMFRLTEAVTELVVSSDPADPLMLGDPPVASAYENESGQSVGHHYGALVQVLHRRAFSAVGGMDERFSGWGGEDVSFMRSVDTLFGRHRTIDAPAYHLWHPVSTGRWKGTKEWEGQERATNSALTSRYGRAFNLPEKMIRLVEERDV